MDVDRAAWTDQSLSHCYQGHTDGPCFLLHIVHLHELFPEGDHSWLELHPGGPEPVLGHFHKVHAGWRWHGESGSSTGYCPGLQRRHSKDLDGGKELILIEHVHHSYRQIVYLQTFFF